MKNTSTLITFCLLSILSNAQQYFTFGPSFTYSRSEWFYQSSPTNTDGNRHPIGWIKGIQSSPGVPLWSAFHMNTDTVRFGKFSGAGNSMLGINSIGGIYRASTYSFVDTNYLATRNWSGLNYQSKLTGTTAQYVRGNGTLATMPTDNSSFTNGAGYITGYIETDPVWTGVSANYRTKIQNDLLYQPVGSYLTSESDPVYLSSTWFGTTNNSANWNTAYSNRISTFSTTGNSGTATFTGNTLNIPNYTLSGLGGQPQLNGTGFVKMTGTTVSYDNSSYPTTTDLTVGLSTKENSIASGTTSQYYRGDKTWQAFDKSSIGLGNVDNTSDANKPISSAVNTALSGKQATLVSGTNIKTVGGNSLLGSGDVAFPSSVGTDSRSGYGTGTPYSLTVSSAKITMGTTSPTVTLPAPGTYVFISNLKLDYAGLTTIGSSTSNFKLRRTNNTASDISNATTSFTTPIVTLLTGPAGDVDMQGAIYTTSTSGDVIEMWGNRGTSISVGNINVSEAWIIAIRIY